MPPRPVCVLCLVPLSEYTLISIYKSFMFFNIVSCFCVALCVGVGVLKSGRTVYVNVQDCGCF